MSRKRIGAALVIIGLLLIAAATCLALSHMRQAARARENAQLLLVELTQAIEENKVAAVFDTVATAQLPTGQSPQLTVSGHALVGILRVPSAQIELPIQNTWSYELLNDSPCRYSGSVAGRDLILLGHNYDGHFKSLPDAALGDSVEYTDVTGESFLYEITGIETLEKTELDKLTATGHDLTIFTCTRGGYSRFVVRCSLVDKSES